MNEPIYGCAGCQTTAGAGGCPVHGQKVKVYPLHPTPESKHPLTDIARRMMELKDEKIASLELHNKDLHAALSLLKAELKERGERIVELQKQLEIQKEDLWNQIKIFKDHNLELYGENCVALDALEECQKRLAGAPKVDLVDVLNDIIARGLSHNGPAQRKVLTPDLKSVGVCDHCDMGADGKHKPDCCRELDTKKQIDPAQKCAATLSGVHWTASVDGVCPACGEKINP